MAAARVTGPTEEREMARRRRRLQGRDGSTEEGENPGGNGFSEEEREERKRESQVRSGFETQNFAKYSRGANKK